MGNPRLGMHRLEVEDGHAGSLAPCPRRSGNADQWFQGARNGSALADRCIDVGEKVRRIGGVEVRRLGGDLGPDSEADDDADLGNLMKTM